MSGLNKTSIYKLRSEQYPKEQVVKSERGKYRFLENKQRLHETSTETAIQEVFSDQPGVAESYIEKKHPISVLDLADVPNAVSDKKLLRYIAYKLRDPGMRKGVNEYIMKDTEDEFLVSPQLFSEFGDRVDATFDKLLKEGWMNIDQMRVVKKYFGEDSANKSLVFKSVEDIISFIRKGPIKNDHTLSPYEKTLYKHIVCVILKQAIIDQEYLHQEKIIEQARRLLDSFVRVDLLDQLQVVPDDEEKVITDKTHVDYFDDKSLVFRREMLQSLGIHTDEDIRVRLSYRSKTEDSIKTKFGVDPKAKATKDAVLHDLCGLKFIALEDARIKDNAKREAKMQEHRLLAMYAMFLLYAKRTQKYKDTLSENMPFNNDGRGFIEGGRYKKDTIRAEDFLNAMSVTGSFDDIRLPLLKDKHALPKVKNHEVTIKGDWALNYELLSKLKITDARFIKALEVAVDHVNIEVEKSRQGHQTAEREIKLGFFASQIQQSLAKDKDANTNPIARVMNQTELSVEDIYHLITKHKEIERRIQNYEAEGRNPVYVISKFPDILKQIGVGIAKKGDQIVLFHVKKGQQQSVVKEVNSASSLETYVNNYPVNSAIAFDDYQKLYELFYEPWKEYKEKAKQKKLHRNNSHKGATFAFAKLMLLLHMNEYDNPTPTETQFFTEAEAKSSRLEDDAIIYGASKQVHRRARYNSSVVSLKDIIYIVDHELLPIFEEKKHMKCVNGMTVGELGEAIAKDDSIAPAGKSLREKMIHNFVENRGLTRVVLQDDSEVFLSQYYDNLAHYGLAYNYKKGDR